MGSAQVMFTVVGTGGDERDVILRADPDTRVSEVTRLLGAERLDIDRTSLDPGLRLSDTPIRDGCRVGLDQPDGERSQPELFTVPKAPLLRVGLGTQWPALLVRRPPRLYTETLAMHSFDVPPPPVGAGLAWLPQGRRRLREYEDLRAQILESADRTREAEEERQRDAYPDPAALYAIAATPGTRLWERRPGDPDFLTVRVGTGGRPSGITLADPVTKEFRELRLAEVPVTVSLPGQGALRIRGATAMTRAACRWLLAQLAVLHSPDDVRICLLTEPSARPDWEWLRWLPHCQPLRGGTVPAWIGNDPQSVTARLAELASIIGERRLADGPAVVAIFDDWSRLHSDPGISRLLRDGPGADVYAICLDPDERGLPEGASLPAAPDQSAARSQTLWAGGPGDSGVPCESVDAAWCERLARALAPLRDDRPRYRGVPDTGRLLNVLDLDPPTPEAIRIRWAADGPPAAVIGETSEGPFGIDLLRDGPHALMAGTTGSGKSELLQTIVASLAAARPPDEITFLLFDYKGGAVFRNCEDLPHTTGVIVDFDQHEARRVLASLSAELQRRELLLSEARAKDIDEYARSRKRQPGLHPLPRLVIIVDEFAAMARELPDFIQGLVNIAQRGRSLGVHIILATQRPTGVVSDGIRSNTNLRIALRVAEAADSQDIIGTQDAASIPNFFPGRAYIRSHSKDPVLVQTSQVTGVREAAPQPLITPAGWEDLGEPMPPARRFADADVTDLTALVGAVRVASEMLGLPAPHQPWLPGLPGVVPLSELKRPAHGDDAQLPPVPYGLEDLPLEQAQRTAVIDFAAFGHLVAAGAPNSGQSQLLRTIAGSAAAAISCADVHLYGIDCDNDALLALAELPHCGAVVTLAQADRAARLIDRLGRELGRRQELLARTRFRSLADQRAHAPETQRLPHILVLINRWEGFLEAFGDYRHEELTDTVMRILREGLTVGMHLIITGRQETLAHGQFATMADKLVFRMADPIGYEMAGLRARDLPVSMPAGRAFHVGSGTEVQVALLDGAPTSSGQAAALLALAEAVRVRDAHVAFAQRPFRVETAGLISDRFHVGDAQGHPVGREDVLAWLRARHATGGSVALLGPRRAGKTWVLRELERQLIRDGHQQVHTVAIQLPSSRVDTPDELATILDHRLRASLFPAEQMLEAAKGNAGTPDRLAYLLDEVGRLAAYGPAAVSWLRDLGQAGAWLVYTGTEKDWQEAVRQALKAPGSSFGNDVDARLLGPLDERDAVTFLVGTSANLRVDLSDETAASIVTMVGAWPFYLQVVGDAVVRAVQIGDPTPLRDARALREIVDSDLLDGWMTHFQGRWAEIGLAGRAALLQEPGRQPGGLTPGQREDLRDVGLLLPGNRWLADPPFFDWIARNATVLGDGEQRR